MIIKVLNKLSGQGAIGYYLEGNVNEQGIISLLEPSKFNLSVANHAHVVINPLYSGYHNASAKVRPDYNLIARLQDSEPIQVAQNLPAMMAGTKENIMFSPFNLEANRQNGIVFIQGCKEIGHSILPLLITGIVWVVLITATILVLCFIGPILWKLVKKFSPKKVAKTGFAKMMAHSHNLANTID